MVLDGATSGIRKECSCVRVDYSRLVLFGTEADNESDLYCIDIVKRFLGAGI